MECVFCKISNREIPKVFTYEDSDVMVFPDISPLKPIHLLIMPKEHVRDFGDIRDVGGDGIFLKVKSVIQKMIKEQKLEDKGYRLVVNGGGAQIIDHFHIHLLGPLGKTVKME
jgi:histidine triad (HIT) family protein